MQAVANVLLGVDSNVVKAAKRTSQQSAEEAFASSDTTTRRTGHVILACAAVCVVALALRLWYINEIRDIGFFDVPLSDAAVYAERARGIAAGDWLGPADFVHAPLYAYVFGLVEAAGGDLAAIRVVQTVLGAVSCVLVVLACRRFFSLPVAVVAGLILAVYPPAIFFDGLIQKTSLALFLSTMLLWIVAVSSGGGRRWMMFGAGVVLGLLVLTRQNAMALAPVVLIWAWFSTREASRWQRTIGVSLCLCGLVAMLFPWALRNRVIIGSWTLTTPNLGQNFAMGNHPEGTGTYLPFRRGRSSGLHEQQEWTRAAEQATGRSMTPSEVSDYYLESALAYVRGEPAAWLKLMGKKLLMVFGAYEAPDTEDYYIYEEWSPLLRVLDRVLHFGVLFPLAAAGVVLVGGRWRELWFLYVWGIVTALAVAVFVVFGRYRFPLIPVLVMFAGAAVVFGVRSIRMGAWKRLGSAGALAVVVALVSNWPVHAERRPYPFSYTNHAIALAEQRRYDEALEELDKALTLAPNDVDADFNKASMLFDLGRVDEALVYFRAARAGDPAYAAAAVGEGNTLLALGREDEAEAAFYQALELDNQQQPSAINGLGQIAARRGRFSSAVDLFERVLKQAPDFVPARINLGNVYLSVGQAAEALSVYETVLELEPDNLDARYNRGVALAMTGAFDEAVAAFESVLRSRPNHRDAQRSLVQALVAAGRYEEARALLDRLLAAEPQRRDLAELRAAMSASGELP